LGARSEAFNYILKRWASFTLFLEDRRVCLSSNAAERGLRGIALGRKAWLFCDVPALYNLIVTAKMNVIDRQVWLADILDRIAAYQLTQLIAWMSCCPGIGRRRQQSPLELRDHASRVRFSRQLRPQPTPDGCDPLRPMASR
jgi:hypothetical protein